MNEDEGFFTFMFVLICGMVIYGFTSTKDNSHINIEIVSYMTKKCETNGGLKYIEHDYDVVCKNGATFEYEYGMEDKK